MCCNTLFRVNIDNKYSETFLPKPFKHIIENTPRGQQHEIKIFYKSDKWEKL